MVESELIEKVRQMREVGYNASEQDSLPFLFKEVFKIPLKENCGDCKPKAWNSLMGWLKKREKPKIKYMAYRIKEKYKERNFVFLSAGKRVVINSENLTEEKAMLMLASKYAHAIEGQPDYVAPAVPVSTETPPNVSEVVTPSTSEPVNKGVKIVKSKGKKKLSKSPS